MPIGDVIRWESHRGRQLEFDEIEAGTARILLNNRHGKYDPTNGASPYSGKLLPLKQTRITMAKPTAPAIFKPQFTGYVERWRFRRKGPRHQTATVELVDGFELLSRAEIAPSMVNGSYFAAQSTKDRQAAALADAGWPAARTKINTGNVNVQPTVYPPGTSALEVCRDAAEAEFPGVGMIFIDKRGRYRFLGRCARFNPTSPQYESSFWRLGDAGAMASDPSLVPIFDVELDYDKEHLYNKALILPQGVSALDTHVRKDQPSIDRYGPRWLDPLTDLLIQSGSTTGNPGLAECTNVFAQYYIDNYKRPYVRASGLEVRASFADATATFLEPLWNFILNVEIGDLVELNTKHPNGGGMAAHEFYVEGIHNYVSPPRYWRQVLDLSPRGRFTKQSYLGCG